MGGGRLAALGERSRRRSRVLEHVRAALPAEMAGSLVSAGFEGTQLTVGVDSAAWAARLRYLTGALQADVGKVLGLHIDSVRIKVVPAQHRPAPDGGSSRE